MANFVDSLFNSAIGDITLILGEVQFGHLEIPEFINFGGRQALYIHKRIGGSRRIDTLGKDDDAISWSGIFMGSTALSRAQKLNDMRSEGKELLLTWGEFSYLVVLANYVPKMEKVSQIPFSITCEVVKDLTQPVTIVLPLGYDDAIISDMQKALDLANAIANPSISTALEATNFLVNGISSFSSATTEQINAVSAGLQTTNSSINAAIGAL